MSLSRASNFASQATAPTPPLRSLFDFGRIEALRPGESHDLTFAVTPRARSRVDESGQWHVAATGEAADVVCEATGGASVTHQLAI